MPLPIPFRLEPARAWLRQAVRPVRRFRDAFRKMAACAPDTRLSPIKVQYLQCLILSIRPCAARR